VYLEFLKGGQVWESGGPKSPSGIRAEAPVGCLEDKVPQKLTYFC